MCMPSKTVKIFRTENGIREILKEAISTANLTGKKRIFIKPNLSHFEYVPGVVTSPELTFELISLLRDKNEEVIVGESDGFNYSCKSAFQNTGMESAVLKAGGKVINLSEDKVVEVKFPNSRSLKSLFLPKTVLDADSAIDLPLMKTHEFMVYSGALKNLFGCVPSNRRIYLHPYLPEVFFRLYFLLKPALTIMDARIGIEGNGPTKGIPVPMDLMLVGNDSLALDIVAAKIMMLNWKETYLTYVSQKAGISEENITVKGIQIKDVARKFALPKIDLPVRAQMEIYKHEYLTKFFFCSLDVVKLFQKVTVTYRGEAVEPA